MSAISIIMGRPTKDPVMQQAKNSQNEYVSLDFPVQQRGQDGENETVFYTCFFNSFLAQRLIKAGVKRGTGLMLYGDISINTYIHQNGKSAGQPGLNVKMNVKDWQFVPASKDSDSDGSNPAPQNGAANPNYGGAATPAAGGYQNQNIPNQNVPNQTAPNQAAPSQPMAPNNNYASNGVPNAAYTGNVNAYAYPPNNNNYQGTPAANNGFSNVPESQMGQLPYPG